MLEKNYIASTVELAIQQGLDELNLQEKQVKIEVIQPGKKGFFGIGKADAEVKLTVIDPELKKLPTIEAVKNRSEHFSQKTEAHTINTERVQYEQPDNKKVIETDVVINATTEKESVSKKHAKTDALNQTEKYITAIIQEMGLNVSATSTFKNNSEVVINLESSEAGRIIGKRGQVLNSLQLLAQNYYNHIEKGYMTVTLDIENYREKRKETLQNLALNMSKKAVATRKPVKFEPMPNYERKIMHQILTNIENIETYSEGREPHRYLVIKAR
ncbi:protein jag [Macrococcoides goetzii]|uniref:RNA-binding protein KhpB n=1 Tax=Macrococcoides goetzii TaxID=1891097 RepID=A0A364JLF0_9STAP|nr:RNA-binding cell elongation regulator Jag/EloR [Macrococcus goetzii]RAI79540.1 protein jag [Macrococcus goetzii]